MTPELFQQYLEGLCNDDEKDQVEHWLQTSSEEELDELLLPRWANSRSIMPQEQSGALWAVLQSGIATQQPAGKVIGMKWVARVAAIFVLLMAGWWWMQKKETTVPVTIVQEEPAYTTDTITVFNAGTHTKEIPLNDGTVVTLSGHSRIQYKKYFTGSRRDIYLEGKALFKVAKDKYRPFTVYCGAVATTALGTVFTVHALSDKKHIAVKLFEGKVVVRHQQQQTILLPGQELTYNEISHTSYIKQQVKPVAVKSSSIQAKEIVFENAPLTEVFDKLQERYAAVIEYNKADVDKMYFTGTISIKDALPIVLKVIAQMNGLELKEQAKGYTIRPTSH